jgi:hypothetical protein
MPQLTLNHDVKVREAVQELIQKFAQIMKVEEDAIEEYEFLMIYNFADMILSYTEISLCVRHKVPFNHLHNWYWSYYANGPKMRMNLYTYINLKGL